MPDREREETLVALSEFMNLKSFEEMLAGWPCGKRNHRVNDMFNIQT